jgi:hypothetical protein
VHRRERGDGGLELARGVVEAAAVVQLEADEVVRDVVVRRDGDRGLEERRAAPPRLRLSRRDERAGDRARAGDGSSQETKSNPRMRSPQTMPSESELSNTPTKDWRARSRISGSTDCKS